MIPKNKQAAQMLEDVSLPDGWQIVKKITKEESNTGGVYSCCYEVVSGERKGFLKAFDYSGASRAGADTENQILNILKAFTYEREILEQCKEYRCKNVVELLGTGKVSVANVSYPDVSYLILEYADGGDIRDVISEKRITDEWKICSLHQIAKALTQLHKIGIAHQDLKPSNIVVKKIVTPTADEKQKIIPFNETFKLTDLGSAFKLNSSVEKLPEHLEKDFSGTWQYCPPELLYGKRDSDPIVRRIGCDLYLLGSMVAFYFTDMSMTGLIKQRLDDSVSWINRDTYGYFEQNKTYLNRAFTGSLQEIHDSIEEPFIRDRVVEVVRYLCNPDPNERGHKKNILGIGNNYSLNRIITIFSEIIRFYKINRLKNGTNS